MAAVAAFRHAARHHAARHHAIGHLAAGHRPTARHAAAAARRVSAAPAGPGTFLSRCSIGARDHPMPPHL